MRNAGVDLLIAPSTIGPAPEGLQSTGDGRMNLPWTEAGTPVATFPLIGTEGGLPLGLQCIGLPGEDELLLARTRAIQQAFRHNGE
jgi:Asp-tRNA(Asn)/Glu-tRNA(Gln) amidotransferase A subunit family amidase